MSLLFHGAVRTPPLGYISKTGGDCSARGNATTWGKPLDYHVPCALGDFLVHDRQVDKLQALVRTWGHDRGQDTHEPMTVPPTGASTVYDHALVVSFMPPAEFSRLRTIIRSSEPWPTAIPTVIRSRYKTCKKTWIPPRILRAVLPRGSTSAVSVGCTRKTGAWDQAVTVLEKSFEIRPRKYDNLFASNLWSLLWPGRACAAQGKLKKAKTMGNFAMENAQRMLGPAHRTTIAISVGLIGILGYKRPAGKTVKSKWESLIEAVLFLIRCAVSTIDEVERKFVERDRRM